MTRTPLLREVFLFEKREIRWDDFRRAREKQARKFEEYCKKQEELGGIEFPPSSFEFEEGKEGYILASNFDTLVWWIPSKNEWIFYDELEDNGLPDHDELMKKFPARK